MGQKVNQKRKEMTTKTSLSCNFKCVKSAQIETKLPLLRFFTDD
jgi:hypothetical protein